MKIPFHNSIRIGFLVASLFTFFAAAGAQQTYVGRYNIYTGFSDLDTPGLNGLNQIGFNLQAGANVNRWLAGGFDYSIQSGNTSLTSNLATPALQAQLGALAVQFAQAGLIGPGYKLSIPLHAVTQTATAGVQLEYRHFARGTLFIRPSLSALRITATPHPNPQDPYATTVAGVLAPNGSLADWTGAYGVGGGGDVNFTKHFGMRAQLDAIWNHPFSNILANGYWSYRWSFGPAFHFGPNVPEHRAK
jgi:hypothetical protein